MAGKRSRQLQRYAPDSRNGAHVESSLAAAFETVSAELLDKVARSGARAGALVFYEEMRLRVAEDEGQLRDAIYHWHDDEAAARGVQRYLVGPNKKQAPQWYWVEYGHWRTNVVFRDENGRTFPITRKLATPVWVPAKPYVRPTWDAKAGAAVQAALQRMSQRFAELTIGGGDAAGE